MDRMTMWCHTCNTWQDTSRERFNWICGACGAAILKCKCTRCGHEWRPRFADPPAHCASCGSEYWNKRRTRVMKVPNRKNRRE